MSTPALRRALGLWALVFYGIVMVQPTAPMPPYGVVSQVARGHVVTCILIAMVAMMLTAISYGRMARAYPSAGSAYTYVGREIHPLLGFMTGWSVALDYLINPVICTIWCSQSMAEMVPGVRPEVWAGLFAVLFTSLNLRGIRTSARVTQTMVLLMCAVVVWFFVAAVRYLIGAPPASFTQPFYDPANFSLRAVSTGTSIAVLTYIGFDGISTLSEEAENPRRNILLATVLTCLITGVLATAQVYLAQLIWPDFRTYPKLETAFVHVAGRAGGPALFHGLNLTLLLATVGSGMGAQLAAARLLYGMGRDGALPTRIFGALDPRRNIPRNNVLVTGAVTLIGALTLTYDMGAELLNFGAFIAFMGVNASAFTHYALRRRGRGLSHYIVPLAGFAICFYAWSSLRTPAKLAGFAWLAAGVIYAAVKTRGFRQQIHFSEPPPE